jgi:hypothetical protein
MPDPSINKELIGKIIQSIQNSPAHHDQKHWAFVPGMTGRAIQDGEYKITAESIENDCGTACCIAGWALLKSNYDFIIEVVNKYPITRFMERGTNEIMDASKIRRTAEDLMSDEYRLDQIFYDMDEKRALSQLMFLYENGDLPELEPFPSSEWMSGDTMQEEDKFYLDFMHQDEFIETWMKRVNEEFPPRKSVQSV